MFLLLYTSITIEKKDNFSTTINLQSVDPVVPQHIAKAASFNEANGS